MCLLCDGSPTEDKRGKFKTFKGNGKFQTGMCSAPCAGCPSTGCWCLAQGFPLTSGCAQFFLRRKVLRGDMSKYSCCQGYFNCCGCKASCGESNCPTCCLCLEAHICNFAAVSASRNYVMEVYDLSSDPCDYRLIQFNNCIQISACICTAMAYAGVPLAKEISTVLNLIADITYACVSGCMTAQTAHQMNYFDKVGPAGAGPAAKAEAEGVTPAYAVPAGQGAQVVAVETY
mmetsp:Transcript_17370/g.29137  ORF Transcript_17370/g.29137 Transcript_17370/m.29137 type:complete len:231 (+) Transcript_17370:34-726(+)